MNVSIENHRIPVAPLGVENPLPMFGDDIGEKDVRHDGTFLPEDQHLFGRDTGFKVLPDLIQDGYGRNRKMTDLKTVVLENDILKARFLPDFGGRLISLWEKGTQRELLYKNPVLQPANLAIRNAWFSGGIEWNIGMFGHSTHTCAPLFFASLTYPDGQEFLRIWEYQRTRRIFWQIDFHLPRGARHLCAHVRIINDAPAAVPMYWWTNIALPENEGCRILSNTDQVLYVKPESVNSQGTFHGFGRGVLPQLPSLPGKDASYPLSFHYSSEYFFQTPEWVKHPWEAVFYTDGSVFYERSTSFLRYRKMFCWGNLPGGRHWCDFLSEEGRGDYIEIQAGLAPTQVHGYPMPGNTEWNFSQFFGVTDLSPGDGRGEWRASRDRIHSRIDTLLPGEEIDRLYRQYADLEKAEPEDIIHQGTGWGALEGKRRRRSGENRPIPRGLIFPDTSLAGPQKTWVKLLEQGRTGGPEQGDAVSWITDESWIPYLEESSRNEPENPWPLLYLGVLHMEAGNKSEALECWRKSIDRSPLPVAWRNIAWVLKARGEREEAVKALLQAARMEGEHPSRHLSEELMDLLVSCNRIEEAWEFYSALPGSIRNHERLVAGAAGAALKMKKHDFLEKALNREFAMIREGDRRLVDLWFSYQNQKTGNTGETDSETLEPPKNIDFRVV